MHSLNVCLKKLRSKYLKDGGRLRALKRRHLLTYGTPMLKYHIKHVDLKASFTFRADSYLLSQAL